MGLLVIRVQRRVTLISRNHISNFPRTHLERRRTRILFILMNPTSRSYEKEKDGKEEEGKIQEGTERKARKEEMIFEGRTTKEGKSTLN